jgi:hypothetical protein
MGATRHHQRRDLAPTPPAAGALGLPQHGGDDLDRPPGLLRVREQATHRRHPGRDPGLVAESVPRDLAEHRVAFVAPRPLRVPCLLPPTRDVARGGEEAREIGVQASEPLVQVGEVERPERDLSAALEEAEEMPVDRSVEPGGHPQGAAVVESALV